MEALSFSFTFFKMKMIMKDEKEGAGNFPQHDYYTETFYGQYRRNKEISFIVDVDDKNCLAELTVALKLNQGVRQWLYIIAGVLFFGTFFCTSKRK
jgi:hypothetical protein